MLFSISLPFLLAPFFFPLITGFMARAMGRKFWPWFFIGLPLPVIGCMLLFILPDAAKTSKNGLASNEKEEIFDHLFAECPANKAEQIGIPSLYQR